MTAICKAVDLLGLSCMVNPDLIFDGGVLCLALFTSGLMSVETPAVRLKIEGGISSMRQSRFSWEGVLASRIYMVWFEGVKSRRVYWSQFGVQVHMGSLVDS